MADVIPSAPAMDQTSQDDPVLRAGAALQLHQQSDNFAKQLMNVYSLLSASASNEVDGVRWAVEHEKVSVNAVGDWQVSPNAPNDRKRRTAAMVAAYSGSVEVLKYLLACKELDINIQSSDDGCTALHCAAMGNSSRVLQTIALLLRSGAGIDKLDYKGRSALDAMSAAADGDGGPTISPDTSPETSPEMTLTKETQAKAEPSKKEEDKKEPMPSAALVATLLERIMSLHSATPNSSGDSTEGHTSPRHSRAAADSDNDLYSSDDFRMYEFKIRRCIRGRSHDWTECPFAHPGEKARRRDPRKYNYTGTACPDFRKGQCKRGDACEYAHGVFECWLHPSRYRTQPCKDGRNCKRRVCFFAHKTEQLRPLPHGLSGMNELSSPGASSPCYQASPLGSPPVSPSNTLNSADARRARQAATLAPPGGSLGLTMPILPASQPPQPAYHHYGLAAQGGQGGDAIAISKARRVSDMGPAGNLTWSPTRSNVNDGSSMGTLSMASLADLLPGSNYGPSSSLGGGGGGGADPLADLNQRGGGGGIDRMSPYGTVDNSPAHQVPPSLPWQQLSAGASNGAGVSRVSSAPMDYLLGGGGPGGGPRPAPTSQRLVSQSMDNFLPGELARMSGLGQHGGAMPVEYMGGGGQGQGQGQAGPSQQQQQQQQHQQQRAQAHAQAQAQAQRQSMLSVEFMVRQAQQQLQQQQQQQQQVQMGGAMGSGLNNGAEDRVGVATHGGPPVKRPSHVRRASDGSFLTTDVGLRFPNQFDDWPSPARDDAHLGWVDSLVNMQ